MGSEMCIRDSLPTAKLNLQECRTSVLHHPTSLPYLPTAKLNLQECRTSVLLDPYTTTPTPNPPKTLFGVFCDLRNLVSARCRTVVWLCLAAGGNLPPPLQVTSLPTNPDPSSLCHALPRIYLCKSPWGLVMWTRHVTLPYRETRHLDSSCGLVIWPPDPRSTPINPYSTNSDSHLPVNG